MKTFSRLCMAAVLSSGLVAPAAAESPASRAACTPSVIRLCPAAAARGDRDAAKRCLLKNLARASPRCQAAVRAEPPEDDPRSQGGDMQR